ncbi:MAG TPA: sugar phosphate nucleotidyltransferase, partial [Vicinamibacterales bacterium]|nr:sugar phosphate nucleotidyltransferase [Vicinamibacterales bacterium]
MISRHATTLVATTVTPDAVAGPADPLRVAAGPRDRVHASGAENLLADDTIAIVLAGGKGTRLDPLTRHVCKPALPFGAGYRSIDFSLANCVNSGIRRVGVATQHKPEALLNHLDGVWRNVVTDPRHFIAPWPAQERAPGGYRGTADAVYRNLEVIEELDRRLVLILAGDHVYKMDYRPMLQQHCERGATVTIGCVEVPLDDAHQFGVLSTDHHGRIDHFVEKPKTAAEIPDGDRVLASMGIYVFDADLLARVLRLDAFSIGSGHDFGRDVLPRLIRDADAFAWQFRASDGVQSAYWRDIGTIDAYWRAHMELLGPSPRMRLDDPDWPLPAGDAPRTIGHRHDWKQRGVVEDSLIAGGCSVGGAVRRSVLFEGVEVSRRAEISDAVILPGAVIGAGCRLRGVIVDSGSRIPAGTVIDRSASGTVPIERLKPVVLTADEAKDALPHLRVRARLSAALGIA